MSRIKICSDMEIFVLSLLENVIDKKDNFYTEKLPSITLYDYLHRLYTYIPANETIFTISFIYLLRIIKKGIILCYKNIFRYLLTSIVLTVKYTDDMVSDNIFLAKVCGISLRELNTLEISLLEKLDFDLFIKTEEFEKYHKLLFY